MTTGGGPATAAPAEASSIGALAAMLLAYVGCAGLIGLDQGIAAASDSGPSDDAAAASVDGSAGLAEGNAAQDASKLEASRFDGPGVESEACPLTACPTGCYDTTSDPQHCGGCSTSCGAGPDSYAVCVHGGCGIACTAGALDCNGLTADGCECRAIPNGNPYCASGACEHACEEGFVDCGGSRCSCGGGNVCLTGGTCGACRAHLQPCGANGDCCSNSCVGSACL
jgi:hypothetical protein